MDLNNVQTFCFQLDASLYNTISDQGLRITFSLTGLLASDMSDSTSQE